MSRTGENQFYFIGDGQKNIEGPIKETRIFGVITGVLRKGKYLDEHTFLHGDFLRISGVM